jgi:hypothetical protein
LQPRPPAAPDYCYSGRLISSRQGGIPSTQGIPVLLFISLPSCCPFFLPKQEFRDEVSFRHWVLIPRRVSAALSVQFQAEALLFPEAL